MSTHTISVKIDDDDNEKIKTSMFLLTINSNKVVNSKKDPFVASFRKQIKELLQKLPDYIVVNANAVQDDNMVINVKSFVEIGKKQHRLHSHSIIEVKHNSNIRLDREKITAALGGYYVNVTFMRSSNDINRMLDYIKKNY